MKSLNELRNDQLTILDLKNLVEVYEEAAAEGMKRIRGKIISGRQFLEELAGLSVTVGSDLEKAAARSKKTAAVFLSANEGLYGNLIGEVFESFLKTVKDEGLAAVVAGETGRQLMAEWAPEVKFTYFKLNEDKEAVDELGQIAELLKDYSSLKVFFARFKNIVNQQPMFEELTGRKVMDLVRLVKGKQGSIEWQFIYEPSAEAVAERFSREIWHNLFFGLMEEHRLAKQAARLMQLDQAMEKINDRSAVLSGLARMAAKKIEDKKQQSRMVRLKL